MKKQAIIEKIENSKARSAWARGVKAYAFDILEDLDDSDFSDGMTRAAIEKSALNGADNWSHYSWGGCSLCYNGDIAERLCTPSELKRTHGGDWRPNSREEWLDVQARALYQAFELIWRAHQAA